MYEKTILAAKNACRGLKVETQNAEPKKKRMPFKYELRRSLTVTFCAHKRDFMTFF